MSNTYGKSYRFQWVIDAKLSYEIGWDNIDLFRSISLWKMIKTFHNHWIPVKLRR